MLKKSRDFAMRYGIILVLKNSYTIIVNADGKMYYNPTGSQFLATAGSGDVLTGITASFRAQGISAVESAIAGVYIHGFAGQLAATESGKYSISATKLLQYISKSIRHLCE
jgi:NAD(P)H-hydrate epimerase